MKKALLSLFVLTVMVVFGAAQAEADETATIGVTVSVTQNLSMTVLPSSWDVGTQALNDNISSYSAANFFTLTNTGNGHSYYDIAATIVGGASLDTIAVGLDTYVIGWGTGTPPPTYEAFATQEDMTDLAYGGSLTFDLEVQTPSSTQLGGVTQTITVTITASAL